VEGCGKVLKIFVWKRVKTHHATPVMEWQDGTKLSAESGILKRGVALEPL